MKYKNGLNINICKAIGEDYVVNKGVSSMKVKDALMIGELRKGKVIAGHTGLQREVTFVEVLEVPDVYGWITSGVLMMTTFYSIKDEPEKQFKVIRDLIERNAAGLVVKLGRFIDQLPEEALELANRHNFPIISIPKEVSYIRVLNPLYETLFKEKQKKERALLNPLLEAVHSSSGSVEKALNNIQSIVESPVYVEDLEGRLLFCSEDFSPDGWRKQDSLFSKPIYPNFQKIIDSWQKELQDRGYTTMNIPGYRNRILISLTSQSDLFAILHIPHKKDFSVEYLEGLQALSDIFSKLFISDQLYHQRKRLDDMNNIEQFLRRSESDYEGKEINVIYFNLPTVDDVYFTTSYLIDYTCIVRRKLYQMVKKLSCFNILICERYNQFYAIVERKIGTYQKMLERWAEIVEAYNIDGHEKFLRIAISPTLNRLDNLEECFHIVRKTLEIGKKIKPGAFIYTFDKLGIYEIMLKFTNDSFAQKYAENILSPLYDDEELLKTLEVYLNENGNISRSAELLFIHRRTMTYRINKIEKLLSLDLNNGMTRFILHFCLLLNKLSK